MSARSQLKRLVPLGLGALALASFIAATSPMSSSDPQLDSLERIAQQTPAQAICDVDGVDVSYHTTYRNDPTYGYDVVDVVVDDVSWPSCSTAELRVALTLTKPDSSTVDALGEIDLSATPPSGYSVQIIGGDEARVTVPARVPPDTVPDAAEATNVAIELEGGTTPIPAECNGMRFRAIQVGTLDDDSLTGTNPAGDLIYGLLGSDTITSLQGDDCVQTDPDDTGDDTITLGNGVNVVTTGAGDDTIEVGNGAKNKITSGDGDDTITVGNGKSNVISAGPGDDTCYVPKSVKVISINGCETVVRT